MTEQKVKIFDRIAAAGDAGIMSRELLGIPSGNLGLQSKRLKAHLHAINDLLQATDYEIRSDGAGQPYKLRLRQKQKLELDGRRARLIKLSLEWNASHR